MTDCMFCNRPAQEREEVDKFQYGVGNDAVILTANVIVISCDDCEEQWTDWRSEDTRQEAVETHLATKGIYLCTVCGSVPVDVSEGIDTCGRCLLSQGIT